jgi:hypothetical protein
LHFVNFSRIARIPVTVSRAALIGMRRVFPGVRVRGLPFILRTIRRRKTMAHEINGFAIEPSNRAAAIVICFGGCVSLAPVPG